MEMPPPARSCLAPALLALTLLSALLPGPASADRGGIPLNHIVYNEEAQNAIAAWNGTEEVLVLTTDLRADRPGKLLEMLPLPSVPSSITQGSREQFLTFINLFNSKIKVQYNGGGYRNGDDAKPGSLSSVQILFQKSIGAHNLTVARVRDAAHFGEWVRDLAARSGVANYTIKDEMNQSVRRHLANGISIFVFDIVEVGPELRSQDPLVYRFNTTKLYYPMEITAASYGNNGGYYPRVNLFLLVNGRIDPDFVKFYGMTMGRGFSGSVTFNQSELGRVGPEIRSLFESGARAAHLYTTGGRFTNDNWKSFEDVVILRSRVQWFDPAIGAGPAELSVEDGRATFLTCFGTALVVAVPAGVVVFTSRRRR
jgi:hypothetical protein